MSAIQENRIQVNGVWYGLEQRGQKDDPALVLLHGFTGSAASWGKHLDVFAESGLRVIALDLLGHGRSDAPGDSRRYAIEQCCDDILCIMNVLDIREGEATLLGYSLGGRIALYTAFAGFFRTLILESASPGLESVDDRYMRRRSDNALASLIEREGIASFVEIWERIPLFTSQAQLSPEVRARLHAQRMNNREVGLANSLRGVGTGEQPSLYSRLHEMTLPTLLITGEFDTKFSEIAQKMVSALPQAQLVIVPGAGHTVHLEQPERFDELVLNFLT